MAEIPYLTLTDAELSESSEIAARYITNTFWLRDGFGQSIPTDTYEPEAAQEGYYEVMPEDANGDLDIPYDAASDIAKYMSEEAWDRLGGQIGLFMDISGGVYLRPYVATQRKYCDNVDNNFANSHPSATFAVTWSGGAGAWILSKAYVVDDSVYHNGVDYICTSAHTSSATNEPGIGGSWTSYWDIATATADKAVKTKTSLGGGPVESMVQVYDNKGSGVRTVELNWKNATSDLYGEGTRVDDYPDALTGRADQPAAFVLTINVHPNAPPNLTANEAKTNRWEVTVTLGEFLMTLKEDEKIKVKIGDTETEMQYKPNAFAEGGRTAQKKDANKCFRFFIYRTFNGVIVSSGIRMDERKQSGKAEDGESVQRNDFSVYCPKNKEFDWKTVWQTFCSDATTGL